MLKSINPNHLLQPTLDVHVVPLPTTNRLFAIAESKWDSIRFLGAMIVCLPSKGVLQVFDVDGNAHCLFSIQLILSNWYQGVQ